MGGLGAEHRKSSTAKGCLQKHGLAKRSQKYRGLREVNCSGRNPHYPTHLHRFRRGSFSWGPIVLRCEGSGGRKMRDGGHCASHPQILTIFGIRLLWRRRSVLLLWQQGQSKSRKPQSADSGHGGARAGTGLKTSLIKAGSSAGRTSSIAAMSGGRVSTPASSHEAAAVTRFPTFPSYVQQEGMQSCSYSRFHFPHHF